MITIFCEKIVKTAISLRAWCKVVQDLYQAAETGLIYVGRRRIFSVCSVWEDLTNIFDVESLSWVDRINNCSREIWKFNFLIQIKIFFSHYDRT